MANPEHLAILAQGVAAWNAWREANPKVRPDLEGADLKGADLRKANLSRTNLTKAKLQGAYLGHAKLEGVELKEASLLWADLKEADLWKANLKGAKLHEANLEKAKLQGSNLNEADLRKANLKGAKLEFANLQSAVLNEVDLEEANLARANLNRANLWKANLNGAYLLEAQIKGAGLQEANLKDANLANADLSNACVSGVRYNRKASYQGIRVDSCYGSQMFKSHAMDQDYIEEFRSKSKCNKFLYFIWLVSSDCGRSMSLWALWSIILLSGFALSYHTLGPTQLHTPEGSLGWVASLYFSFATFSTLGFGDIYPLCSAARLWAMAEVMIGYIMLGGLISILANKLAKRA